MARNGMAELRWVVRTQVLRQARPVPDAYVYGSYTVERDGMEWMPANAHEQPASWPLSSLQHRPNAGLGSELAAGRQAGPDHPPRSAGGSTSKQPRTRTAIASLCSVWPAPARAWKRRSGLSSRLEVDAAAEPCIQVHLELRHLVPQRAEPVLKGRDVLLSLRIRSRQHLLRLLEGDVEEGVADLVPVAHLCPSQPPTDHSSVRMRCPRRRRGAAGAIVRGETVLRDKFFLVGELQLRRDVVEFLLLFLRA